MHFRLKIWQLVATILMIFADSQLAKFRTVFHPDGCCKQWAVVITMPVGLVQSRFAETRFAETLTLTITLTLNPNFGESGFGESGRHRWFV